MNLLRLMFPVMLAAVLPATLSAAASSMPPPDAPKLGSTVFRWDELAVRKTAKGEARHVANNPTATLKFFESHVTTLNPGQIAHPPHQHPHEELIIVKEGTVEVNLNGVAQVAGPGSTFFYAPNDPHGLRNAGDTPATYWVVTFATAATHNPADHDPAPALRSAVLDWEKLPVQPTPSGARRQILKGSTATAKNLSMHCTTVHAGLALHGAHRHPDEEIVIVREGALEVTIEGRSEPAPAGSVIFIAPNDLHGMRNAGDTQAGYFIIRLITEATAKAVAKM
ncbi:MAG: cupin domain-containing protein [Opitutus sp.]